MYFASKPETLATGRCLDQLAHAKQR